VTKSLAVAVLFAVLAAGCGGSGGENRIAVTTAPTTTQTSRSNSPAARDYRQLYADVHDMRAEARRTSKSTLLGTRGLRTTTGAFLDDLATSALGPKARNRMIDHAAAAVATRCEQCFQMLEATRPIPEIAGH
jgi:hypothetical protein